MLSTLKFHRFVPESQISSNCRYIESIHNMRKPVISSEISPKFDGVPTACILPIPQFYRML